MDARVASRYGRALYDVAVKQGVVAPVSDDLASVTAALERDPRFADFLASPSQSRESKMVILERVFADRVTALTMQLIRLVMEKRREMLIPLIASEFDRLRREDSNVLFAVVTSAQPLAEEYRRAILTKLERSGGKRVEAEFLTDASLLGGVRVQIGNNVIDGSVKGNLGRLRDRLLYDLLKQS